MGSVSAHDALSDVPENERLACLICHLLADEETAVNQIASAMFVLARLATMLPSVERRALALRFARHASELGAQWH